MKSQQRHSFILYWRRTKNKKIKTADWRPTDIFTIWLNSICKKSKYILIRDLKFKSEMVSKHQCVRGLWSSYLFSLKQCLPNVLLVFSFVFTLLWSCIIESLSCCKMPLRVHFCTNLDFPSTVDTCCWILGYPIQT